MTAASACWWQVTDFSRMALCDVHLDVRVRQGDDEAKDLATAPQRHRVRVRFRVLRTMLIRVTVALADTVGLGPPTVGKQDAAVP